MRITRRKLLRAGVAAGALSLAPANSWLLIGADRAAAAPTTIQNAAFNGVWSRTDQLVAQGQVNRTWMWGPAPLEDAVTEIYADAPNSIRLVQYFDKARMELNAPTGNSTSPWFVTNGLLAKELATGQMQMGDASFLPFAPAAINVAGDPDDPDGPTYATFNPLRGYQAIPSGWVITQTLDRAGHVGTDDTVRNYGVTAQDVGAPTSHTVASVFWAFMTSSGPTWSGGIDQLFPNPFYAVGYPLTEAYWTTVRVGGTPKRVLVQLFERRVLTYTPDNSAGWQVEAGNVGQHYHAWRYDQIDQALPPPFLKDLARQQGMDAGVVLMPGLWQNAQWRRIVTREFNALTIDWGMYWKEIEPERGQFVFDTVDEQVAFAQTDGMRVRGHPLLYGTDPTNASIPDWLKTGGFSRTQLVAIIQEHVRQIVSRYRGRVTAWVVVNESYVPPWRTADFFYNAVGSDYISIAFAAARASDPNAVLLYNDYDNHLPNSATTQLTRQIVTQLKPQGLIDGVGLQMHLDGANPPDKQDVIATMRSYGVPVYVTEFDIDLQNVPGSEADRLAVQARIAADMAQASRESGVCRGFSCWDIGDKYSWINWQVGHAKGEATPLDDSLFPKPMWYAVIDAMK